MPSGAGDRKLVALRVLELVVRRDHPLPAEDWGTVKRAARRGAAAPEHLRAAARADAEAILRSSDLGVAPMWLVFGFVALAVLNLVRWLADRGAPWAVPMTALYLLLALSTWYGRRARAGRARAALAANAD